MLNIGPQELLLILVIALIVVGPQRLPQLGRSIGRGLREIRKAQDEVKRTIQVNLDEEAPGTTPRGAAVQAEPAPPTGEAPPIGSGTDPQPAPSAVQPDPTPLASDPPSPSDVAEVSRALGRSLHELRRAREEIRKSFHVDLGEPSPRAPAGERSSATRRGVEPPPTNEAPAG